VGLAEWCFCYYFSLTSLFQAVLAFATSHCEEETNAEFNALVAALPVSVRVTVN